MGSAIAIKAHLSVQGLDGPSLVYQLRICEAMNALTRARAVLIVRDSLHSVLGAVGAPAVLELSDPLEGSSRELALLVVGVELLREWPDRAEVAFELAPPEALLTERSGYRMFVEKTTVEIVKEIMEAAGLRSTALDLRLSAKAPLRPQTVQYDETDWEFLTRILADEGIAFWFEAQRGRSVLVLGDSASAPEGLELDARVPFVEASAMVSVRHFSELSLEESVVTAGVHVREDDVRHPNVRIEGHAAFGKRPGRSEEASAGEYCEYPARVRSQEQAQGRAQVRLEQLTRDACVVEGQSDLIRLWPGRLLEIAGDVEEEFRGPFLVTRVEHILVAPELRAEWPETGGNSARGDKDARGGDGAQGYSNRATLVPALSLYRPLPIEWPAVFDVEPATTTGPEGEEIHVNDLGDVKLKMPWDRTSVTSDRSSTWARTLQSNMGGSVLLPRVGWEVPVLYRNGDPDRPLVLGRLYNGASPMPCPLPAQAASSYLHSATTPGGGSANGIRLDDSKGREGLAITASGAQTVVVGGASITTVAGNESHDVALSYAVQAASQTVTVGGEESVNVVKNYEVAVGGARLETIGDSESNSVTGNRVVQTGAYTESIGGAQATQCIQALLDTQGNFLNLVGGAFLHSAASGISETVAGARSHLVGAARSIQCASYSESAVAKSILAGPSELIAAGGCSTQCASGTIDAASLSAEASGKVTFDAKTITVTASTLTTGGGSLGGGALQVKGSKFQGTIERAGDTKLGS